MELIGATVVATLRRALAAAKSSAQPAEGVVAASWARTRERGARSEELGTRAAARRS